MTKSNNIFQVCIFLNNKVDIFLLLNIKNLRGMFGPIRKRCLL